jgi:ubiquitin-conjugating enzyme (huntingtin interacting protein 2)
LNKELADIMQDEDNSSIKARLKDAADFRNLIGTFPGPPDTVYAGGHFEVDITIPDQYPFKPPGMRLNTKIWHPNISSQTV